MQVFGFFILNNNRPKNENPLGVKSAKFVGRSGRSVLLKSYKKKKKKYDKKQMQLKTDENESREVASMERRDIIFLSLSQKAVERLLNS